MPKQRRTPTGTAKRPKGLTLAEGRDRAKKAWVTKHQRYKYATGHVQRAQPNFDADGAPKGKERLSAKRRAASDPDVERERFDTREMLDANARRYTESGSVDPAFAANLGNVSKRTQEEFYAKAQAHKARQLRLHAIARDQDNSYEVPAAGNPGEVTEKGVRTRIIPLINPEPRSVGGRKGQVHFVDKDETAAIDKRLAALDDEFARRFTGSEIDNMSHRDKADYLGRIKTEYGERRHRILNTSEFDAPETINNAALRKRVRTEVKSSFVATDPVKGVEGLMVSSDKLKELEDAIVLSHTHPEAAVRLAAATKARNLTGQLAQHAGRAHQNRYEQAFHLRVEETIAKQNLEDAARAQGIPVEHNPFRRLPREQRLNNSMYRPLTVEDMYDAYGHEQPIAGGSPKKRMEQTKEKIKAQARFNRTIASNKYNNLIGGDFTAGVDGSGKRVGDLEKAAIRLGPNSKWQYQLNDLSKPDNGFGAPRIQQELPHWDTKTTHKVGRRNRRGELMEGQADELVSEKRVARLTGAFDISQGERGRASGDLDLGPRESKELFIPIKGAKTVSRSRQDPNEKFTQKLVKVPAGDVRMSHTLGNEWMEATDLEYANAPKDDRRLQSFPKTQRITVIDPGELETRGRTDLSIKIPGFDTKVPRINPYVGLPELRNEHFGERVVDIDLEQIAGGSAARAYTTFHDNVAESRTRRLSADAAQEQHYKELHESNRITGKARGSMKEIATAGGYAAYYGSKSSTREHAKHRSNKAYAGFYNKTPGFKKWANTHGYTPEDIKFGVNESVVQPSIHKRVNLKRSLRHPLSSPEGNTFGIEWGPLTRREGPVGKFIPLSDETVARNKMKQTAERIERITATEAHIKDSLYKEGVSGKVARFRQEPFKEWKEYKEFHQNPIFDPSGKQTHEGGLLFRAYKDAEETMNTFEKGSSAHTEATKLLHLTKKLRGMEDSERAWEGTKDLAPIMGEFPRRKQSRRIPLPDMSNNVHRNLAIGGAAAGTALGASYLYHRHQEKKRYEADPTYTGTSFYNKVIPGPISRPGLDVKTTAHYKIGSNVIANEFGVAGKKLPVRFTASKGKKTLWKGSPADRGYAAKSSIFGTPKVRGLAPGGSKLDSAFFDQTNSRPRNSFVPNGQQISVAGKKLPLKVEFGNQQKVSLSATNPNKISSQEAEAIAWAFKGHPEEAEVKAFFGPNHKVTKLMGNRKEMQRIRKDRGDSYMPVKNWYRAPGLAENDSDLDPETGKPAFLRRNTPEDYEKFAYTRSVTPAYINGVPNRAGKTVRVSNYAEGHKPSMGGSTAGVEPYSSIGTREVYNPASQIWRQARPGEAGVETKYDEAFRGGTGTPTKRTRTVKAYSRDPETHELTDLGHTKQVTDWDVSGSGYDTIKRPAGDTRRTPGALSEDQPFNPRKQPDNHPRNRKK